MTAQPTILQATNLASLPWLRHAFSTRQGGLSTAYGRPDDLNLGLTPADQPETIHQNRRRLLCATVEYPEAWTMITARQTHSTILRPITTLPSPPEEADALLTTLPQAALAILTADCVPILLADTRHRIVAAVHAGWRGTAAHILEQTIQHLRDHHRSHPEDLLAAIGPSIGPCCYQVGPELQDHFPADLFQNNHLDLWQANRSQLLASGLPPENIETLAQCTACTRTPTGQRLFFSHRAEQGHTGRQMSLIGIAITERALKACHPSAKREDLLLPLAFAFSSVIFRKARRPASRLLPQRFQ